MLNFRFMIVFWVTRIGLYALVPKKHISFLILFSAAALHPPSVCLV